MIKTNKNNRESVTFGSKEICQDLGQENIRDMVLISLVKEVEIVSVIWT